MPSEATKLNIVAREGANSRDVRRLRRSGSVPGVLYGGEQEPMAFAVGERDLRLALAATGAVVELELDGTTTPAVLKDAQRHPVRGETVHVDFLRVRLDVAISAVVPIELTGEEHAPGVIEGGVLEHVTREINIEALPNEIPERIEHDVSTMQINDTLLLSAITTPAGVTLLDDPDETVLATLTPPRLQAELDALDAELEEETERVGEAAGPADADGEPDDDASDGDE